MKKKKTKSLKVILSSCTKLPLFICSSAAHNALIHACNYEITTKLGLAHRALCPHPTTCRCLFVASVNICGGAWKQTNLARDHLLRLRLPLPDVRIISTWFCLLTHFPPSPIFRILFQPLSDFGWFHGFGVPKQMQNDVRFWEMRFTPLLCKLLSDGSDFH